MIDLTTPYREILKKKPANVQQEIVCIRQGSIEPVYDSYIRYYAPHISVRFTNIYEYMQEESEAPTVAILTLREIAPTLWEKLYILSENDVRTHIENVRRLLLQLIIKMERDSSRPILFLLYEKSPIFKEPNAYSAEDIAAELNSYIISVVRSTRIVDTAQVAAQIGGASFWSEKAFYRFGCPYSQAGCNALAYYTTEMLRQTAEKKCIVCDCDDVLWGGILAEDGFDGIKLSGEFVGRAYRDFQRELTRLISNGVLLCLCSKNDESDVLDVLQNHPDMILREEHIAAMRISYNNKADSIRSLALELNISASDMVFLDDNAYEIGLVQRELPELLCIQMDSQQPAGYVDTLRKMPCFYKSYVTDEDRLRTHQYQSAKKRKSYLHKASNLADYHASLKTKLDIQPAEDFDLPRIAQLALRTNQCNLADTHPDIIELRQITEDESRVLLRLRASDIYGDMGIVGAAVMKTTGHHAYITHFWLSCRVFHRGFEDEMLDQLCKIAKAKGCEELFGVYVPTEKNRMFAEFYQRNGIKLYE